MEGSMELLRLWDNGKKFRRFVDKIDPYNKVHWQRNILAFKKTCDLTLLKKIEEDTTDIILLKDIDEKAKRFELLSKKLKICNVIYDFSKENMAKKKQIKKQILSEILEYLIHCNDVLTSKIYPDIIGMVKKNIFRKLLPSVEAIDFEDNHYAMEPSRAHIIPVYEIFLQFLKLPDFKISSARSYINEEFIDQILYLFHSQDPVERNLLKEILLDIYKKFVILRSHIRRTFYDFCWRYIFESKYIVGLPNLIEFYSSVISGFLKPLRTEHLIFFKDVFLKLHSTYMFPAYFTQFVDCIYEFLLKDPSLYEDLIKTLVMYWPKTSSKKQILFLNEINDLLKDIRGQEFYTIMIPLFKVLSRSVTSSNYFVTEATMDLLYNTHICSLVHLNNKVLVPLILPHLVRASSDVKNPDKERINVAIKQYQYKMQSMSFADVTNDHNMALKKESDSKSLWIQVDEIEKRLLPHLLALTPSTKIITEVEAKFVTLSEEELLDIFPHEVEFISSLFYPLDSQERLSEDSEDTEAAEEEEADTIQSASEESEVKLSLYERRLSSLFFRESLTSHSAFFDNRKWQGVLNISRIISKLVNQKSSKSDDVNSEKTK